MAILILLTINFTRVAIFPSSAYGLRMSRNWIGFMIFTPWVIAYEHYVLAGFRQQYVSICSTLTMLLFYNSSLHSGVISFVQAVFLFVYTFLVHTVSLTYPHLRWTKPAEVDRLGLDGALAAYVSFFVFAGVCSLLNKYTNLRSEVAAFNNANLDSSSTTRVAEFVDRLLPKHVREAVAANTTVMDIEDNVTLLFADIVGFTNYSADKNPTQVVEMLSKLFTAFDIECNKLNLYKVYTIGDCYVVMSFLDKNNRIKPEQECEGVVKLGFKMIEIIARVRREVNFDGLHMRIGIHTGKIIGGVIGTGIIRYDMYGQDVLIANKMESSGESDMIHVSEQTKAMLSNSGRHPYEFTDNGDVEIKALDRKVRGYLLQKRGNFNPQR